MEAVSCEDSTSKKKVAALRVSKANPEKKLGMELCNDCWN